ncbi:Cilia- and flagella-associated protein 52 [Pleodorina starrii]|uniref:Cilia- and flagella-associated protein 52 n=1 Tax=Pleodorina starrii TaxID=330485 RepID=A0A9W6BMY3_9CHLO|nr:Cilia- and flagella-associated protein 52 [Pleodorina starrii]GLC54700.1 Cilia- and flagella-associated protein 52 [Pleodorina starrii]GLC67036.1 Cilia- and flagella-associated protein 52 [Pleodorina starrii]
MAEPLVLNSVIGFGGQIDNGLLVHPDGRTIIYPLGSTIVLRDRTDPRSQEFLQGHSDKVSCLALSRSGKYLATGQITYMGFTADIIIWDLETKQLLHRMALHKVKVQALDFSCDERYLASLGGQDDNALVLWDVQTGNAICGSPTATNFTTCVKFFNNSNDRLVTAGNFNLNVWTYDSVNNKLRPQDASLGTLKRVFKTICIDVNDQYVHCGTTTGDVLQIALERVLFKNTGPAKGNVQLGVTASCEAPTGDLMVGGGDGSLQVLRTAPEPSSANPKLLRKMTALAATKLEGAVTSISLADVTSRSFTFYVGTAMCNIYKVIYEPATGRLKEELIQTAHADKINGLAFPHEYSEVFATCGTGFIRLWHLTTCRELLRISVPNLECHCVTFTTDGSAILSGWSDGRIRAFGPQSGKIIFTINDAHQKAVTAIASTSDSSKIISGGEEGMVRVWRLGRTSQSLEASMKDHKGPVNCIRVKFADDECVSASSDGSCIIWDLHTYKRRTSLFSNTFFKSVVYHPDESQLVTTGTDRKITYWDAYDGNAIRIIDGSDGDEVNALAVDRDGEAIVSGGGDKLVKLWGYDEGHCYFVGVAHSGAVSGIGVTPDKQRIVSVGTEGGIFIWDYQRPQTLADI